jgi:hypothetical protein
MSDVTRILNAIEQGDGQAAEELCIEVGSTVTGDFPHFWARICTSSHGPIQRWEESFFPCAAIPALKTNGAMRFAEERMLFEIAVMMRVVAKQLSCAATYQSNRDLACLTSMT